MENGTTKSPLIVHVNFGRALSLDWELTTASRRGRNKSGTGACRIEGDEILVDLVSDAGDKLHFKAFRRGGARLPHPEDVGPSDIYTLRIECVAGFYLCEECVRIVEVPADATLQDLHTIIQDAVDFDRDHLHDFYIANQVYGHKREALSLYDNWEDRMQEYGEILLADIWPLGRKRLYYIFDYGDGWRFEIRKQRGENKPDPDLDYPRLIDSVGPNPQQYPEFQE